MSDLDYNPLIDDEESSSDEETRALEMRQVVAEQKEEILTLRDCIRELNEKLAECDSQLSIMRNTIRRLRFQSEAQSSNDRRDHVFFDASRRKFLQAWDGTLDFFKSVPMEQLAFLAHILNLPTEEKD